jgi:hypothetical protein
MRGFPWINSFGLILSVCFVLFGALAGRAAPPRFDHVYVVVLENHDFDDALFNGPSPFLRRLAETQGLATRYFGVTHPSLPNYLALIGGDDFGVRNDRPSCFASDLWPLAACNRIVGDSLVDQLRRAGLTFAIYEESLPEPGSLVVSAPGGRKGALYAQKHNPVAYFKDLADGQSLPRLVKPYAALAGDLAGKAPNVAFIVPDQCHDGHGQPACTDRDQLIAAYDAFVREVVTAIRASKNFTRHSAIVITFDEGEPSLYPDAPPSRFSRGLPDPDHNHIATVIVTRCGAAVKDATRYDHYSLLATIEDGFGLKRLRKARTATAMTGLFADRCGR